MSKRYQVCLSDEQRGSCEKLLRSRTASARQRTHARILLLADQHAPAGSRTDGAISETARTSLATVARVRRRFVAGGLEAALLHQPQENRKEPALDGVAEAHLIALVCGAPPAGHQRWSLHLLKDRLIEQGYTNTVSHETVRQRLKKTNLSLG
jgi:Homeodomain-like domain